MLVKLLFIVTGLLIMLGVCFVMLGTITNVLNPHFKWWMGLVPVLNIRALSHCAFTQDELAYGSHKFLVFYLPNALPTVISLLQLISGVVTFVLSYLFRIDLDSVIAEFHAGVHSTIAIIYFVAMLACILSTTLLLLIVLVLWIRVYKLLNGVDLDDGVHPGSTLVAIMLFIVPIIAFLYLTFYKPEKHGLHYWIVEEFDEEFDYY